MKKILTTIIICLLFACSKTSNPPSASNPQTTPPIMPPVVPIVHDTAGFYGIMVVQNQFIDTMADYSVSGSYPGPVTPWAYRFNNLEEYSMDPACSAIPAIVPIPGDIIVMEHFGSTTNGNIKITFAAPSLSSFSNYQSNMRVETTSSSQRGVVNVSFNMTGEKDGTFAITGKIQGNIDSVAFSFNGGFKNIQ